jgi:hypothetical protein
LANWCEGNEHASLISRRIFIVYNKLFA